MGYVPERNLKKAHEIESHKINVLVAPAGYGKTALVRSLNLPNLIEQTLIEQNGAYEDSWNDLIKLAQKYPPLAEALSEIPAPTNAADFLSVFTLLHLHKEEISEPCYLFIDNAHNSIHKGDFSALLDAVELLPENIHLIFATRNDILTLADRVKLGPNLYEIGKADFKLTEEEVVEYASSMGIEIDQNAASFLHNRTEGWPGCLYGILSQYKQTNAWPDVNAFVCGVVSQVVPADSIDDRLAVLSLVDTFNNEFAHYMWNELEKAQAGDAADIDRDTVKKISKIEAAEMLRNYESTTGFVDSVPCGMESQWRFHWAFRFCVADRFDCMPKSVRHAMHDALTDWVAAGEKTPSSSERRDADASATRTTQNATAEKKAQKSEESKKTSAGNAYIDACFGKELRVEDFPELTEREVKLVSLAIRRLSNAEIALQLFLSEGTVKVYFNNVYSKLDIQGDARGKRTALEEIVADRLQQH